MQTSGADPESKTMKTLFSSLPGLETPVGEIQDRLRHMWEGEPGSERSLADYHAVQLNLVLHFGLQGQRQHALQAFDTAIDVAQRYPARIIVLCPIDDGDEAAHRSRRL